MWTIEVLGRDTSGPYEGFVVGIYADVEGVEIALETDEYDEADALKFGFTRTLF